MIHYPVELVSAIVNEKVIENWEAQDIPAHLKTIRDRILQSDERGRGRLLGLYQQVLDGDGIPADEGYDQMQLRLTGLVVKRDGRLIVYNPIYGVVFNHIWASRALADTRPTFYGSAFQSWQESNDQKESFLLWGQALADAEAWAKGKRLSDEDDQFLRESREVEKRVINLKLESERLARKTAEGTNHILMVAEKTANTSYINSAYFSPDGKEIVTASLDKTTRIWDSKDDQTPERQSNNNVDFIIDFDRLLILGCAKLHDYLSTNPNSTDSDRQMCGIEVRKKEKGKNSD